MARKYLPALYVKLTIAEIARMNDDDMERLFKKINCIKMQAQIYDYLVGELYPVPECDNCEYNFTRFSSGKCFRCDGVSEYGAPSKGHCRLFDEMHGRLVLPRRCKKLFASAFNFPEGIELVVVGKQKQE